MGRIVRYHRAANADLPDASGYHDPVTSRFIDATRLSRRQRSLPDDCFERKALGGNWVAADDPSGAGLAAARKPT
jgi:hypothetical protein